MKKNSDDNPGNHPWWLIFSCIWLVIYPMKIGYVYGVMYTGETYTDLTTPGGSSYHPLWSSVLTFQYVVFFVTALTNAALLYLYFKKKSYFPSAYFALGVFTLLLIPLNSWIMTFVFEDRQVLSGVDRRSFIRALVQFFIWVPYMHYSERAKTIFVH